MEYIVETGNPYFTKPRISKIVRKTKTLLITEHQRFKMPRELKDGVMVERHPREMFDLCTFTYRVVER